MADGSDAVADWPLLNALVNTAAGASWVSIHHGGGRRDRLLAARRDGRRRRRHRRWRPRSWSASSPRIPAMGVFRHVDAGYERAIEVARERGVRVPMLDELSRRCRSALARRGLCPRSRSPGAPGPAFATRHVPDRSRYRQEAIVRADRRRPFVRDIATVASRAARESTAHSSRICEATLASHGRRNRSPLIARDTIFPTDPTRRTLPPQPQPGPPCPGIGVCEITEVVERVGHRRLGPPRAAVPRRSAAASRGASGRDVISSGHDRHERPDRADPDRRMQADRRGDDPADDLADRDRAPDDESHRGVHPALHRGRGDGLAEAHLVDVVDDHAEAGDEAGHDEERDRRGRRCERDERESRVPR